MRLRSVLERHPGAGVLWTGVTGKVCVLNVWFGNVDLEMVIWNV